MSSTIIQSTAADLGGYSSEVATEMAAEGEYLPRVANALLALQAAAIADIESLQAGTSISGILPAANVVQQVRGARGVVTSNVADLSAFTVAGNDGLTYSAGQIVLLAKQTTGTQDGPYVVGTVGGGTAALTRPSWWAAASIQPAEVEFVINEGTSWKHSRWFASATGAITVGTTAPAFCPRQQKGTSSALSGTPGTITISNVFLLATTSNIQLTPNTPGGTPGILSAPVGSRSAALGTGQFVINSSANDTATVDWLITN